MITLAAFHGLATVQAGQNSAQAIALGGVAAMVPATANRLRVSIESVWAMPADRAISAIVETMVELSTSGAFTDVPVLLDRVSTLAAEASVRIRVECGLPVDGVSLDEINAELVKLGEPVIAA